MIDAIDTDDVETLVDVHQRVLLVHITVHRQAIAELGRALRNTAANFTGGLPFSSESSPTPDNPVLDERNRLLQGEHGGLSAHVPQETEDELSVDPELPGGAFPVPA